MREYYFPLSTGYSIFSELYSMLCSLNRRNELNRLVDWAERKKLFHPLRLYRIRLADEERRILHYRLKSPRMLRAAYFLHSLSRFINPRLKYLAKGSAQIYSLRGLTHQPKTYSILFRTT